jgi:mono/diheme cytochrome c family protein
MPAGALPRLLLCFTLLLPITACEWFTDFKRTPMVTTWESDSLLKVRGAPQGSVPTTGMAVAALQVSYLALPATLDSIAALVSNPTPVTEASLANGRLYYEINCAVCHGSTGAGDGSATRYGMIPMPIITDVTKTRSDGYLFAMIRNGRGVMPSYNRIEESDRWDVVNYLRSLQGMVAGVQAPTGPMAMPGVTGRAVPGATALGPNRWVPHVSARTPATGPVPATADTSAARPQGAQQ